MTHKQQIFWAIVGAVLAAALGAVLTNWLSKPSTPPVSKVVVWSTTRVLPEEFCSNKSEKEIIPTQCSVVAIDVKNTEFEDLKNINLKIDFRGVSSELMSNGKFDVSADSHFLSSDVKVSSPSEFQRDIHFENFPGLSGAQITLTIRGVSYYDPKIVPGDGTQLVNVSDRVNDASIGKYLLAALLGFLLLPLIAGVVAFFQWLGKGDKQAAEKQADV